VGYLEFGMISAKGLPQDICKKGFLYSTFRFKAAKKKPVKKEQQISGATVSLAR
jgi:hypothetical protein